MVANGIVRKMEGHEAIYRACAVAINLAREALNSKWNGRQQQTSGFLACSLAGRNGSAGVKKMKMKGREGNTQRVIMVHMQYCRV
jgi:hypothetical protein